MDEKSMIIEQERQAKAKKRKKYKKIKWTAGILAVVLAGGSIWYVSQGRYLLEASQTVSVEFVAEDNQEIVYAYIEKINGNEITYRITEEPVTIQMNTENTGTSGDRSQMPEGMNFGNGEMPDFDSGELPEGMNFGNGEMPDFGSGELPEGMNFGDGEMPDFGNAAESGNQTPANGAMTGGMSSRGERPNMGGRGQGGEASGNNDKTTGSSDEAAGNGEMPDFGNGEIPEGMTTGTTSEQTYTKYIPVGTDVTTKLGTVTTFSRLAAGDTVALIMEKDGEEQVIVAVYIVG